MQSLKVYLDDERETPEGWYRTYSAQETIDVLQRHHVSELSLDHDLGDETTSCCGNGYDVLLWIEQAVMCCGFIPPAIKVHSANVSARIKMELAIAAIVKHTGKRHAKEQN